MVLLILIEFLLVYCSEEVFDLLSYLTNNDVSSTRLAILVVQLLVPMWKIAFTTKTNLAFRFSKINLLENVK